MNHVLIEFCASFLIYFLFLGLLILWVIDGKIKKEQVIHALFSVLVAFVASEIIKSIFPTLRPYVVNGQVTDVLIPPVNGSFPSTHTAVAFALSVTVFLHDRKYGVYFLLSALLIGLARVLANVHYPIDILCGAFSGITIALIVDKTHFMDLFKKKN